MTSSLGEFITQKLTGEKLSDKAYTETCAEMRKLRQTLTLPEPAYYTICFRAFCQEASRANPGKEQDTKWKKVEGLIMEKNS